MNKSLLALLLVCAIAGMAFAFPNNDVGSDVPDEATPGRIIQLLKILQTMEEMEDQVSQQSNGKKATAQFWGSLAKHAAGLLG